MAQAKEVIYRYRWVILLVVWLGFTSAWIQRLAIPPLSPFLRDELQFTHTQIGTLMSVVAFATLVINLPAGWLVDRFGIRPVLLICQVIAGICFMGMAQVNSFTSAVVIMALVGLWIGGLSPATTKGVIHWFPVRERATVMGLKQTGVNIGGIIMSATMPTLALAWGWHSGFIFVGAMVIAFGIITFSLYKNPPVSVDLPVEVPSDVSSKADSTKSLFREIILTREILCLSFGSLFICSVEFGVLAHLAVYLNEALLFSVVVAGMGLAVLQGGGAFGKPLAGLISDRIFGGSRRKPFIIFTSVACLLCVAMMFVNQATPGWLLFPLLAVLGFTAVGWGGLHLTLVGEFAGKEHTGMVLGFSTTIVASGGSIGPLVFGYLVDLSGSYRPAWLLMAIFAAMCVILIAFVRESKRRI